MSVRVYYGDALARYAFGEGHPFGADRVRAFWKEFVARGLDKRVEIAVPVVASVEDLARFHDIDYVRKVQEISVVGAGFLDYGDTPAFPGIFDAACHVVGSVLDAAKHVLSAPGRRAFVPIAGLHHAGRDRAAGFCVFNDVGVVIETLRSVHGISRIAYIDIDAHHGDGVYYAFAEDPELYIADMHEDGRYLYPGTGRAQECGEGVARGTKLNIPLLPGAGEADFKHAWSAVEAFLGRVRPEFILFQAGADSIAGDPLTDLALTLECHAHAAARLSAWADGCCQGRLLALGGGGYSRKNLARAWCAVVEAMLS